MKTEGVEAGGLAVSPISRLRSLPWREHFRELKATGLAGCHHARSFRGGDGLGPAPRHLQAPSRVSSPKQTEAHGRAGCQMGS